MTRDAKNAVRQEAVDALRAWIKPGDTIHTQLKSVSRSGMSRVIQVVQITCKDGEPSVSYLGYNVAQACGFNYDREREGVKISGCGMDMGFSLVYELSAALFSGRFDCIGESCPSNDHSNGDRNYKPHAHSDGGYALKQRWL